MELGNMVFGHSRGEFEIERGVGFEQELGRLFEAVGHDPMRDGYAPSFENDAIEIRPYWWGDDCICPEETCTPYPGCDACKPNFKHKPSGYELRWYKYPLRDSYANKNLTLEQFRALIDECIASVKP